MKPLHGKTAYLAVGVAMALSVAGASAVQAQGNGSGQSTDGGAVATARSNVSAHAKVVGFGSDQSLVVKDTVIDRDGSSHVRFTRTYRGLPLVGGDLVVHQRSNGSYRSMSGEKVSGLPSNTKASVSGATARATAARSVRYTVAKSDSRLVVLAGQGSSLLAWQVNTAGAKAEHGDVTFVDARSGRILASWATVMNDDSDWIADIGTGHTLYDGTVQIGTLKHKSQNRWLLIDRKRGYQRTLNLHHTTSDAAAWAINDGNNVWGNGSTSWEQTAGVDAHFALSKTWDYFLNTYNRRGIADDGVAADAFVHYSTNYFNAFWSDACFCMHFGDGQPGVAGPLVTLDISGHEMAHGVTSRTAGLNYFGEAGGLNEATSDIFGAEVEWYADNSVDVPDYVIGSEIFLDYDPANNYIRRMDEPSRDGNSADCWYDGVGNLDVHYSSGVANHWYYLMSEGSGSKTINGIPYDSPTCDGSSVGGIGHKKAAAIWYRALTTYMVPTTNYHQARVATLKAATDLYGAGSAEYDAANDAWAAVDVTP